ncbi:MAG: ribose 5-phosphate isomerase B [Pseudomonadota bacterium]|nr:ribose 5-phosphate isomerase B [Pseudomonadota bacterium]
MTTIAIACDHAGLSLKTRLVDHLRKSGIEPLDLGTFNEESVDYPDFADLLATALAKGRAETGILICGSGIGISIAANRHRHIRAALCHDTTIARLAREHNNANVLALGARITETKVACDILDTFLATPFAGGRHEKRVAKLGKTPASC